MIPDGNWSQVVDANGNVRRTTNLRGYATNHALDAINRVTETRTPGDSSIGGSGGYSGGNHLTQYAYEGGSALAAHNVWVLIRAPTGK